MGLREEVHGGQRKRLQGVVQTYAPPNPPPHRSPGILGLQPKEQKGAEGCLGGR